MNFFNPVYNAYAAFEEIYSAIPGSIRSFILLVGVLFVFCALHSIFRG